MALIEIHNATIWRGSTCVFENLNLRIEEDERVAILGPNGSGGNFTRWPGKAAG